MLLATKEDNKIPRHLKKGLMTDFHLRQNFRVPKEIVIRLGTSLPVLGLNLDGHLPT